MDNKNSGAAGPGSTSGRTILLVDDETAIRRFLRLVLIDQQFEVIEAADGRQALAAAAGHAEPIGLLLLDIILPDLNGYELAQRIKLIHPEAKVLYISGYVASEAVQSHLSEGTAFLQKPFPLDALVATVQQMMPRASSEPCAVGAAL